MAGPPVDERNRTVESKRRVEMFYASAAPGPRRSTVPLGLRTWRSETTPRPSPGCVLASRRLARKPDTFFGIRTSRPTTRIETHATTHSNQPRQVRGEGLAAPGSARHVDL